MPPVNGPVGCGHDPACHAGPTAASAGSAPETSRAWLLIQHPGPWPAEPLDAGLPEPLHVLAKAAYAAGARVQLIRRPGRAGRASSGTGAVVFTGWCAGDTPWLKRTVIPGGLDAERAAADLAAGRPPGGLVTEDAGPLYLVCTHARRNACCSRYGLPLATRLAGRYPGQVWESSHVGGHRFAANLVLLPHAWYYGPADEPAAVAAIEGYRHGTISPDRLRGRAGLPSADQPRPGGQGSGPAA